MILRLVIAFTRWVWGVSPAFITADSDVWYLAMFFGALIDLCVTVVLVAVLLDWLQFGFGKSH